MEPMRLSEIAALFSAELPDGEVKKVVTDTRRIEKDCLFVALRGERFDGADFVEEALESGAAAAISERAFPEQPVITVPDAREALGRLSAYYKSKFSVLTVAVTGSSGKTTTKEFLSAVLSERFRTLKTSGNLNNDIGLPMTIFELEERHEACVLEMGMNHRGELSCLTKIARPDIAVITNIGTAHIENLGSREGIAQAKLEILEGLRPDGAIVLNGDEPLLTGNPALAGKRVVRFGLESPEAEVRATDIFELSGETDFIIETEDGPFAAVIHTIGRHNVQNALCAAAVGKLAGLTEEEIRRGLLNFEATEGRQKIYELSGVRIIDDTYNANPDSMRASLSVLGSFEGRRIAVLGDMLELGAYAESAHRTVGELAAENAELLFALGDAACYYKKGALLRGMEEGAARHFSDAESLGKALAAEVREGDTVLFKGSRGMRMERMIEMLIREWK